MGVYRIVYTNKSRILSCTEISEEVKREVPYYERDNGQLSFAIIEAANESQARSVAKYIALELMQKDILNELKRKIADK